MKPTLQRIQEIKRLGYALDLGETINDTFANYKKIALLSGAVILLVIVASIVIVAGLASLIIGVSSATETFTEISKGAFSSTGLAISLVLSIVGAGLFAPITAGLIQMAHNASVTEEFDFGTAFIHYKTAYFKELFLSAAIITLIGSGFSTLFQIMTVHYPDSDFVQIGTIASSLIGVLLQLFTILMIPLIIFGNLTAVDAIKGSFTVVAKNFWIILLLLLVCGVFIVFGLLAFCIGILFTLPAFYSLQYIIYKTALPIEEENELEEIGQNLS